jgi:hypothetical protein
MTHYDPTTPGPIPEGSPGIWQHLDRVEKAAKLATILAAVALLIGVVALVIAILAVTDDDERGDFQPDSHAALRTPGVWVN